MYHHRSRFILVFVLLSAATLLAGCGGGEPGYEEKAPPAGGPQPNSHMPPGEKAAGEKPASPASPGGPGGPGGPGH